MSDRLKQAEEKIAQCKITLHAATNDIWAVQSDLKELEKRLLAVDEYARWAAIDIVNGKPVQPFDEWYDEKYGE
jgi:hypothetical protein